MKNFQDEVSAGKIHVFSKMNGRTKRQVRATVIRLAREAGAGRGAGRIACAVCGDTVRELDLDLAHVQSDKHGGGAMVNNLLAACRPCNVNMGSMHLLDYCEPHYDGRDAWSGYLDDDPGIYVMPDTVRPPRTR